MEIKEVVIGVMLQGAVISRKMVGNAVLKANNPKNLSEFGGHVTLTDEWARGILLSIDWVKWKGTSEKIEPSTQLLAEERFTFQRLLFMIMTYQAILFIINLDQTPVSYMSPGKKDI